VFSQTDNDFIEKKKRSQIRKDAAVNRNSNMNQRSSTNDKSGQDSSFQRRAQNSSQNRDYGPKKFYRSNDSKRPSNEKNDLATGSTAVSATTSATSFRNTGSAYATTRPRRNTNTQKTFEEKLEDEYKVYQERYKSILLYLLLLLHISHMLHFVSLVLCSIF
jgi:hypothetical protein